MADVTLRRKSARELARLIRERAVSPVEVLDAHLAAVAEINPSLNAIVTLAAEQAQAAARRPKRAAAKGEPPSHQYHARLSRRRSTRIIPAEDAEVVRRLKAAGAIILAKTNTPEFACGANTNNALFGPTRNPWNPH